MKISNAKVKKCEFTECVHNSRKKCYAKKIRIGSAAPRCETRQKPKRKRLPEIPEPIIDVCSVSTCVFNKNNHCSAYIVEIYDKRGEPYCGTYEEP